jgi:hypothetical protein
VSHAALTSTQVLNDLTLIDDLIAEVDRSGVDQIAKDIAILVLEHLHSARAYLPAGMPEEYAATLGSVKENANRLADTRLRHDLHMVIDHLLLEMLRNDQVCQIGDRHQVHRRNHGRTPPAAQSPLWRFFSLTDTSFGVFYPKRHIVAVFPSFTLARRAESVLVKVGFEGEEMIAATGADMLIFLDELSTYSGLWGALMERISRGFATEEAFVDEDLRRAGEGAGFLAAYTPADAEAEQVRDLIAPIGATSMQRYMLTGIQSLI